MLCAVVGAYMVAFMCRVRVSICFFFFKQKTAYEMRISDWSSDVCSSDLLKQVLPVEVLRQERDVVFMIDDLVALQQAIREARAEPTAERRQAIIDRIDLFERRVHDMGETYSFRDQIVRASCRERVCQYV